MEPDTIVSDSSLYDNSTGDNVDSHDNEYEAENILDYCDSSKMRMIQEANIDATVVNIGGPK